MVAIVVCSVLWVYSSWGGTTSSRSVSELLSILASPDLPHIDKWNAVQEIRQHGRKAAPGLLELLRTNETNARYYAIRAIGYIKNLDATGVLCKILLDREYGPRRYAAVALGQIGSPQAVDALRKALDDVPHVRQDALDALVKIGSNEATRAVEEYHFGNPTSNLQLRILSEKSVYALGDTIRLDATLTNISNKSVLLSMKEGKPFGYLVFRRKGGAFIEEIDTGLRDQRGVTMGAQLYDLTHGATLQCSFAGRVAMWTRGEKDGHAFMPSGSPFLTLDFRQVAFHIRELGEYYVRAVFKQDHELIERLKATGVSEEKLALVWRGKAVSKPVCLTVTLRQSEYSQTESKEPL